MIIIRVTKEQEAEKDLPGSHMVSFTIKALISNQRDKLGMTIRKHP